MNVHLNRKTAVSFFIQRVLPSGGYFKICFQSTFCFLIFFYILSSKKEKKNIKRINNKSELIIKKNNISKKKIQNIFQVMHRCIL